MKITFAFVFIIALTFAAFADVRLPDTPQPSVKTESAVDANICLCQRRTAAVFAQNQRQSIR